MLNNITMSICRPGKQRTKLAKSIHQSHNGLGMWKSIKKETFANCVNSSTKVNSQEMDTKVHPDECMTSKNTCTTINQKPPVDVTRGHKVPNTAKLMEMQRPANKRSHICCSCFKSFANNSNLQRHFRTRCKRLCTEVFPDGTGIIKHNIPVQVVSSEMFICDQCSKGFSRKADFNRYVDLEHRVEQTSHSCYLCPEAFDDVSSLRTHLNAHMSDSNKQHADSLRCESDEQHDDYLPEPQYSCNICSVMFADEYILAEHVLIAHSPELLCADKKPLLSELCPDACEVVDELDNSVNESSAVPSHDCNLCPESFEDASGLAEHIRNPLSVSSSLNKEQEDNANRHKRTSVKMGTHQAREPVTRIHHACHLCSEGFAKGTTLQRHVRTVHGAVTKRLNTECPGSSRQSNFKKTHFCDQCSKSFLSKGNLTRHQMTHTLSRPFACHLCPGTFTLKGILKQHVQRHSGLKRFSCPHCSKEFLVKAEMYVHMRTHTGERPYACKVCSAAYSAQDNLQQHVAIHTGLRPFACPQCPRSFVRYQDLKRHSLRHTGERPFVCMWCPRTFTHRHLLREHVEAAHQVNKTPAT